MTRIPKSGRPGGPRQLEPEEQTLWNHVTQEIEPLKKQNPREDTTNPRKQDHAIKRKRQRVPSGTPFKIKETIQTFRHGHAPGLDKRTQLRLRRGQVKIEARLDLHGMTQREAHSALIRFIEDAITAGRRTVLVITGKGLQADGRTGVLRGAVPKWLNEAPLRSWIKAFDHAALKDGGEGALYVLLRRTR